ncbi:MAG: VWA domain-containing protein [Deltaproteobacteria bacterium]|nr:VWA domain-containing protein [Deltaproteobacteria bacterium]
MRRGSVTPVMVLTLLILLTFAGLAIDWTYVRTSEFELKNATDAAAHAALVELRRSGDQGRARTLAKELAELNTAAGVPVHLSDDAVEFGEWDYETGTFIAGSAVQNGVRVTAERTEGSNDGPISLFIGPLFGHSASAVAETAVGAYRSRDIMVSIDISTSMIEEMDDAVKALVQFASSMQSRSLPNDRVGLNVFKTSATTISSLTDVDSNISALKTAWQGDGKSNRDKTKSTGVTNCYITYCKKAIAGCGGKDYQLKGSWMPKCESWGHDGNWSGSNQGSGLLAASQTLTSNDTYHNTQAIIFISDGRPTCPAGSACVKARTQYAIDMANAAWNEGINVFTISLNATSSPTQTAFMASLVRGYGKAYETTTSKDLEEMLLDIESNIPIALVE